MNLRRGIARSRPRNFCPTPGLELQKRGRRRNDQINNKQTSNKVARGFRINVSCCSRSDKFICANESGQPRRSDAKAGLTTTS